MQLCHKDIENDYEIEFSHYQYVNLNWFDFEVLL